MAWTSVLSSSRLIVIPKAMREMHYTANHKACKETRDLASWLALLLSII